MVEIIPKKDLESSKKLNSLFYAAVLFLLFSVGGYFVLDNLLQRAEKESILLKSELAEVMTAEKVSLEKEVLGAKDKIDKFSILVDQHLVSSRIFRIVEGKTHPKAWFREFNFDPIKGELKISGETQNFVTLGQQTLLFKEEPRIESVNLISFLINQEGKIDFSLLLSFDQKIFKK